MNNFVFCSIETTKKVFDSIKVKTDGDDYDVSFNMIIPAPETIEECLEKYDGRYILKKEDGTIDEDDWFDSYSWCLFNWGAGRIRIVDVNIEDDNVSIYFESDAFPKKIIKFLCSKFPDEVIKGNTEDFYGAFLPFDWENKNGKFKIAEVYKDYYEDADL